MLPQNVSHPNSATGLSARVECAQSVACAALFPVLHVTIFTCRPPNPPDALIAFAAAFAPLVKSASSVMPGSWIEFSAKTIGGLLAADALALA